MIEKLLLFLNTLLLAFTISTDDFFLSFSYSLSNPEMEPKTQRSITLIFSSLQVTALLLGWIVTDVLELVFHPFINVVPYILLVFLCLVGLKLFIEGIYLKNHSITRIYDFSIKGIFLHGLTSSIDAWTLGISLAGSSFIDVALIIIPVFFMTHLRCASGIKLGKKVNGRIPFNAGIISGIIIVLIAVEIFIRMIKA